MLIYSFFALKQASKYSKIQLRAFGISKIFPKIIPRTPILWKVKGIGKAENGRVGTG
jgi:hypothetical protein